MFNVIQKQLIKLILICLPNLILITLTNSFIVRLTSTQIATLRWAGVGLRAFGSLA